MVTVRYRGEFQCWQLQKLGEAIQVAVAKWLSCEDEDGSLEPSHVEVEFRMATKNDILSHNLGIDVQANWFPHRFADLGASQCNIMADLGVVLRTMGWKGGWYVWVRLFPASFGEGIIE